MLEQKQQQQRFNSYLSSVGYFHCKRSVITPSHCTLSEMAERRPRGEDAASAAEEYGKTKIEMQLLRALCKRYKITLDEEAVKTLYAYLDEKALSTVDGVIEHYAVLHERAKDVMDDYEMAFKRLCQVLSHKNALVDAVANIHRWDLFATLPGASMTEMRALTTLRPVLELASTVCEQYKAEEKDRNSSSYQLALDIVKESGKMPLVDLKRLEVRCEVYLDTGVLTTCVNLRDLNQKVLGKAFDPKSHLAEAAKDYSREGFTPHLAAKPGLDSRLALSRIAQDPGVHDLILLWPWLCYCWASMALIQDWRVARLNMYLFGSYLQLPGARGAIGGACAVVAMGTVKMQMNASDFERFKEDIKGARGEVIEVQSTYFQSPGQRWTFEVLKVSDDSNTKVTFVKRHVDLSRCRAAWLDSKDPFGGMQLLAPEEPFCYVTIDSPGGVEHPFIEPLIARCSTKLGAVGSFLAVNLDSGLNNTGTSFSYVPQPSACPALLAIIDNPHEAFVTACGRSRVIFEPPTELQHASTLKLLAGLKREDTVALVHQKKNGNSKLNSETGALSQHAEATNEKAVVLACDVVSKTIKDEYGICQSGATAEGTGNVFPLTPMQRATATLISDPDGAPGRDAIAYLKPRVGAAHVDVLQKFGRELAADKDKILALAAPSATARSKRRRRS